MILRDTPPSSPPMEDEVDEDEMVYIGDADEVLDALDHEENDSDSEPDENRLIKDDAACVFSAHEGSVFCGSLNKDGTLAATGGEDDRAFVWDVASGQVVLECTGHTDSVTFAEFNQDGSYLATADMNGVVQVWKMSNKLLIWDYNVGDMTWMRWHPVASVLFAGAASGEIYMWKIPGGECKIFQSHGQRVEQGVLMPDGKRIAVGYEDGALRIFDLKSAAVLATISSDFGHSSTITALDSHSDNNLIMSGAMDGKTVLAISQSGKVIGVLQNLKDSEPSASEPSATVGDEESREERTTNWVEAIAFCKDPEYQVAATGTVNGQIYIWDISKQVPRHAIQQDSGISKLVWYLKTSILYSSGLDGVVRCYDARSGQHLRSFSGHSADILDLVISSDGRTMLTTSDDGTARIFKIGEEN